MAEIVLRSMEHFANPYCKFVLNKAFIQKSNGTHITRVTTFPLCLEIYGMGVTATRTLANYSCRKRTPFLVTWCNVRHAFPFCVQGYQFVTLGTRRSTIGQCFSLFPVTIPDVFVKVNSVQFPSRF